MEGDLGAASPSAALSAGDLLCAGLSAHLGGFSAQEGASASGADKGHAGSGAPRLTCCQSQPNTALVKPTSLGTGMSLCWMRPAGHCFFESLHSQLSTPLFWVPSPFYSILSKKDCGPLIPPSMSFQSVWSFACLLWTSHCLFLKIPIPVQVRQQHPAARGPLHGWSLVQHPNVPQQHVAAVWCLSGRAVTNSRACLLSSAHSTSRLWD